MAFPNINTTITGSGNQGLQIGQNTGSIEAHYYPPGKCSLPPGLALR
jgi:hypothetical protein